MSDNTRLVTVRLTREVWGKLDIIRAFVRHTSGKPCTLNMLINTMLAAEIQLWEDNNPQTSLQASEVYPVFSPLDDDDDSKVDANTRDNEAGKHV